MTRSALDDIREIATYQRGIPAAADARMIVQGILVAVDTVANRVKVSYEGSTGVDMLAMGGFTYVVGDMVHVFRNPFGGGDQVVCLGPVGGTTAELPDAPTGGGTTATAVATIPPQWTGTWDANSSRYDNWNIGRTAYGGRDTLYQGDKFGSGPLVGLATYGDQIVALGAIIIQSIAVTLRGAGLAGPEYPAIELQAATNASPAGEPALAGTAVTGAPGKSGVVQVALDPSVLEGFRTGTYKGVGLAGTGSGEYAAVRGRTDADGMVLTVNYTRAI